MQFSGGARLGEKVQHMQEIDHVDKKKVAIGRTDLCGAYRKINPSGRAMIRGCSQLAYR